MAEAFATNIEGIIECPICMDRMIDSRMLDCQHSFCIECLKRLVVNGKIECPNCRKLMPVPSDGVAGIKPDLIVNKLSDAFNRRFQNKGTAICPSCPVSQGGHLALDWFCEECEDLMCNLCAKNHKKLSVFANHKLNKLEKCPKHPKKQQSFVCTVCQILICNTCVMLEHSTHEVTETKQYLIGCKQEMKKLLVQVKAGYSASVDEAIRKIDIENVEETVDKRITQIQKDIDQAADQRISRIKEEQKQFTTSLASSKSQFKSWVSSVKQAKLYICKIQELDTSVGQFVADTTLGEDLLNKYKGLVSNINTAISDMACNEELLLSVNPLETPTEFLASDLSMTLGDILTTAEIQPGVNFNTFSKESKEPKSNPTSDEAVSECHVQKSPPSSNDNRKLSMNQIYKELDMLIIRKKAENEQVSKWIQMNIQPTGWSKEKQFIQILMISVSKSAINQMKVDRPVLINRKDLLIQYLNHELELEKEALYGLQALVNSYNHPPGMLQTFFDVLFHEDIISKSAFMQWKTCVRPKKEFGKLLTLTSVNTFFCTLDKCSDLK